MIWIKRIIADWMLRRYFMKVRPYEKHLPWIPKWSKTGSEGALTTTTMKAANIPADAWQIPEGLMVAEMRFRVDGDRDNPTSTAHIYAARFAEGGSYDSPNYDDIVHVCDLALTGGEQAATNNSSYYVDTVTVTGKWIDNIEKADAAGSDGQARIAFDCVGYDCLFVKHEFAARNWWIDVSGFVKF